MNTIGYAIIGSGYMGAELGRSMLEEAGTRIRAITPSSNAPAVAAELNCDIEADMDALLRRSDVDAVIIASPNYAHKEAVLAAANHGKHVFCEKPIALSYEDCDAMIEACHAKGLIFMAGHVMNFFDGVRRAKQLIGDGAIGEILYCHSARNTWEEPRPAISWKKNREKSGGHLYHHIHELDCILFLMGTPRTMTMTGGNVAHPAADEEDLLLLQLEFPRKRFATLEYGSAFRWPEHYILIQGTSGAIKIDMLDVGMTLRTEKGMEKFLVHKTQAEDDERSAIYSGTAKDGAAMYGKPGKLPPTWMHSIMRDEMALFNRVLRGETPDAEFAPLFNGKAARESIAVADALTLSLVENRKVQLDEIIRR